MMGRKQHLSRKRGWDNPNEIHRTIPKQLKRYANRKDRHDSKLVGGME